MSGLDFGALMQAGILGLQLRPAEFWALTPAELQMMLGRTAVETPMGRAALAALQDTYPDKKE
ncbi:rcc01693 family protein [Yoonia sp. 208BN28-4]|uniref:rcc01693 family protein n=1 Tax=Yoonia sp. 208BN28-4 TaxID=3126505 RepID=UPI00309B3E00